MNIPHNLFDILDLVDSFIGRFRNKSSSADLEYGDGSISIRKKYLDEAYARYDNIVGRFDVPTQVAARELENVLIEDVEELTKLGARYDSVAKQWRVPESKTDLEPFKKWWPNVPADLLDNTPRMLMTKDGRQIEGYVLGEDRYHGADSTATSIMYIALPIIGALAWCLGAISPALSYAAMLLSLPYLYALGQGEGPAEAVKAAVLLMIVPFVLANGIGAGIGSGLGSGADLDDLSGMSGVMGFGVKLGAALAAYLILALGIFVWNLLFSSEETSAGFSSFGERVKDALKWSGLIVLAGLVVSLLPSFIAPVYVFGLACFYPMFYTEKNFKARGLKLHGQGEEYNLGTQGALTNAHIPARRDQAISAFKDKSPIIHLGKAIGHQTTKHYQFAPDAGADMVLSCYDFSMHFLGFGATGSGKTSSMVRPIVAQYKQSREGGALIRCGKGSLPGELRSIIDIMIEPGMSYAFMEGMDAQQVALALNSVGSKNSKHGSDIWDNTAKIVMDHMTVILEALVKHQSQYLNVAISEVRMLELNIANQMAELIKREKRGADVELYKKQLVELKKQKDSWESTRDAERKWYWNIDSLNRLANLINSPTMMGNSMVPHRSLLDAVNFLGYNYESERMLTKPMTIHPEIGKGGLLDGSLEYVLSTWLQIHAEARSSYMMNIQDRLNPLMRGKYLCDADGTPWYMLEKGADAGQALYGKFVGLNLPAHVHGRSALIIMALVRQRVYSGVHKRSEFGGEWQKMLPGQMPLMDIFDECQLGVGDEEKAMAPIARSLGLKMAFFTQGYEALEVRFGDRHATEEFANTFQSIGCLRASIQTYDYLVKRFGTAQMVRFPKATIGLDYEGGIQNAVNSPLSDLNHSHRSVFRKLERMGAGRLEGMMEDDDNEFHGHQVRSRKDSKIKKTIKIPTGGKKEIMPVFLPEEYSALLATRGRAILWLNRAGAPRVDIAQLNYIPDDALRAPKPEVVEEAA